MNYRARVTAPRGQKQFGRQNVVNAISSCLTTSLAVADSDASNAQLNDNMMCGLLPIYMLITLLKYNDNIKYNENKKMENPMTQILLELNL